MIVCCVFMRVARCVLVFSVGACADLAGDAFHLTSEDGATDAAMSITGEGDATNTAPPSCQEGEIRSRWQRPRAMQSRRAVDHHLGVRELHALRRRRAALQGARVPAGRSAMQRRRAASL